MLNIKSNVLVIGDLHAPFIKKGYLDHCKETKKKYKCNKVVFIGDILDNHASSYWESNPDGMSAGDELDNAIKTLKPWVKSFPNAFVCFGNHDRIIARKLMSSGLSNRWIKNFNEIIDAPGWTFGTEKVIDDVLYFHGEGAMNLRATILNRRQSVVAGHFHTKAEIIYNASEKDLLFGMAVGCGIDDKSYAMEYAKFNVKKSIISCGVVLEGKTPIIITQNL
jgi:predicted phosphodiesterase